MGRKVISLRKAIIISVILLILPITSWIASYTIFSSKLRDLRSEVRKAEEQVEALRLKVLSKKRPRELSKSTAVNFINQLVKSIPVKVEQLTETKDTVTLIAKMPYSSFTAMLREVERNHQLVEIQSLSAEPISQNEVFTYITLKGYKSRGEEINISSEVLNLQVPWYTRDSFKQFLISRGVLAPEKPEKPQEEVRQADIPEEKEEIELEEPPAITSADISERLIQEYTFKGILEIGGSKYLIVEHRVDGKISRLKVGDIIPITISLGEEGKSLPLKLVMIKDNSAVFSYGDIFTEVPVISN